MPRPLLNNKASLARLLDLLDWSSVSESVSVSDPRSLFFGRLNRCLVAGAALCFASHFYTMLHCNYIADNMHSIVNFTIKDTHSITHLLHCDCIASEISFSLCWDKIVWPLDWRDRSLTRFRLLKRNTCIIKSESSNKKQLCRWCLWWVEPQKLNWLLHYDYRLRMIGAVGDHCDHSLLRNLLFLIARPVFRCQKYTLEQIACWHASSTSQLWSEQAEIKILWDCGDLSAVMRV